MREATKTKDIWAIFRGTNGWRLLIALWPKLMQQFVGLSVFNSYSTYFVSTAHSSDSSEIDTRLMTHPVPARGQQATLPGHGHPRLRPVDLVYHLRHLHGCLRVSRVGAGSTRREVLELAYETDHLASRRPLTIYPYCICTVAVLGLGIVGCFDYTSYALGSLLVRDVSPFPRTSSCYHPGVLPPCRHLIGRLADHSRRTDLLRLRRHLHLHRR